MLRWLTAGESHGRALIAIIDGLPAGVPITTADLVTSLARRRHGYGRGPRMAFEQDEVELTAGVRHGETIGAPVAVRIDNTEWPKWVEVMAADPVPPNVLAALARSEPLTRPRPGHADLAGIQKYGFTDARPVLERASARETAARVALATLAASYLRVVCGVELVSHTVAVGRAVAAGDPRPRPADRERIDGDPVRATTSADSRAMVAAIDAARADGDTLGGVVEVLAYGLPPGLGSYAQADRKLDARLAGALMSIPAIKGVEIGDGFALAQMRGSVAQDEIEPVPDGLARRSTHAGGIEGGLSTGQVLRVRAAMKPLSTLPRPLATVDVATGESATAITQRSDVCAVPAAGVVAEAAVAFELAAAVADKFGGDSVREARRNVSAYLDGLGALRPAERRIPE